MAADLSAITQQFLARASAPAAAPDCPPVLSPRDVEALRCAFDSSLSVIAELTLLQSAIHLAMESRSTDGLAVPIAASATGLSDPGKLYTNGTPDPQIIHLRVSMPGTADPGVIEQLFVGGSQGAVRGTGSASATVPANPSVGASTVLQSGQVEVFTLMPGQQLWSTLVGSKSGVATVALSITAIFAVYEQLRTSVARRLQQSGRR